MTIIVCPLSHVADQVAARRPSHLITLLDPADMIPTPEGVARHLRVGVNDIPEPTEGLIHPEETHVRQILDFARDWDARAPMLVHCWAGISRSTATAFILACERNPAVSEHLIAWTLRTAARHAYPNRALVALGDDLLGRGGRMVDAVEAIGDNDFVSMGRPFDLPVRF